MVDGYRRTPEQPRCIHGISDDALCANCLVHEQHQKILELAAQLHNQEQANQGLQKGMRRKNRLIERLRKRQIPKGWYIGIDNNGKPELVDRGEAIERDMLDEKIRTGVKEQP